MPERIQRQRAKSWRMPPNTVYVGRPTIWGSPFPNSEQGIEAYRNLVSGIVIPWMIYLGDLRGWQQRFAPCGHPSEWARSTLRGKSLACWCPLDKPCHADVLLELANA